jgi:exodeoxyribonuclease V alpha subunit
VFLAGLYRAEQSIVSRLKALINGPPPWPEIAADKAIPWVEGKTGLALAESQKNAARTALASKVMVIKTTLVNVILRILAAKRVNLLLCAPTGRAAKRMSDTTGREAKTIHRLLEVDPRNGSFKRNEENTLDCELLVVDETSMVDVLLMNSLLKAVPNDAAVIFVGDVDQLLPSGRDRRSPTSSQARPFPSCILPRCSGRPPTARSSRVRTGSTPGNCRTS